LTRIAFVGMGIMGSPMALHLADAGHEVIGMANAKAVAKLVQHGGRGAASVGEGVSEADVVITMVPDSPDVESVTLGSDGIYANVGLAGNAILKRKGPGMLERQFTPGFRGDLHQKDMGIVVAAAREAEVAIPLGNHVADLISSVRAQGYGSLDHTALLLQVEKLSRRDSGEPTDRPG
jgi:3-hydroxyisobutyrate dehydrogenase-like beta-hydroxyacid dehydrogenase